MFWNSLGYKELTVQFIWRHSCILNWCGVTTFNRIMLILQGSQNRCCTCNQTWEGIAHSSLTHIPNPFCSASREWERALSLGSRVVPGKRGRKLLRHDGNAAEIYRFMHSHKATDGIALPSQRYTGEYHNKMLLSEIHNIGTAPGIAINKCHFP